MQSARERGSSGTMQSNSPVLSGSLNGHSRIAKMMLHLSLEGRRKSQAWPDRNAVTLERAPQDLWSAEWDSTEWSPRTRLTVFLAAALGSWAVLLGLVYLLWQAL